MPEYLAPGVYIEERPGQRSIEGVSTSTAGFVGMTVRGPIQGPPVLVTSFGEFQRAFGGYLDIVPDSTLGEHGHLPLAVKQFFDNGGKRAFIARAFKSRAAAADDLRMTRLAVGVASRLRATAPSGSTYAFLTTARGFTPGTSSLVRESGAGAPTVAITALDTGTWKAHVAALTEDYKIDTAFVRFTNVTANGSAKLIAREPGVWGESVRVQVRAAAAAAVGVTTALPAGAVTIPVASAASFYRGATIQINDVTTVNGEDHVTNVHYATVTAITGNILTIAALATALPAYATPTKTWVALAEVEILISWGTLVERFRGSWRYVDRATPPAGWSAADVDEFNALHSVWLALHQRSTLVRLDSTSDVPAAGFLPTPYAEGDPLATHPTTMDGGPVALGPDGAIAATPNTPDLTPGFPEYVGNPAAGPGARSALASLSDESTIALVAIPGITGPAVQEALITHVENEKYRFAVLDAPRTADIAQVRSHRGHYDSQYSALYYPWLQISDPRTGEAIEVPPSGSMLGICARVDVERGVFKAPANEVVRNATDLVTNVTRGTQEVLNPEGINVVRDFRAQNRGIRVWGARTISSDPEWKYVNVRRLFIFIEHSIDIGTQWVVFEPNNQQLWGSVRRTIETFLEAQWRTGALFGAKKEDAFYVKCDLSTMSADDIANGRLVVEIGIAPTRPAEFVIFRIGQFTADASSN
ncbi:MAG TPA: phage tail sheath subtilisin-like domain-containing protein [Polyangiaceae bacterium]|nr:phage tail sheath subtilisin-like domain-containing protein [Polyangiaceae bacterium]